MGSFTKFFGTVRQKIFYRKSWYSPLRHKVFRYPKFSETQTGSSTKFFGTVRPKIFDGKTWYPPFSSIKLFETKNFLKNSRIPLRNFSVRQKISTKPWCPPPSYSWKFSTKKIFWNTKVLSNEIFWYCETKTFRRKIVIPPPLLSIKIFSLPEIFWNTEWFPDEVFSVLWDKKISTKPWSFPPPLLENFRYENSFETQKCSTNFIGTVRQKFFNGV